MTKEKFKKIGKRFVSVIICAIMLVTSISLHDIWSVISKAEIFNSSHELAEAGSGSYFSKYAINIPELVYLKAGQPNSEYFLNSNSDGSITSPTNDNGTFSFSCATAKDIKVSARLYAINAAGTDLVNLGTSDPNLSSIELSDGTKVSSFTKNANTSIKTFSGSFSLSIKSLSLSANIPNSSYIIMWTYTYSTNDGKSYTTYAFTGVKCPNLVQAGMVAYSSVTASQYVLGHATPRQFAYTFLTGVDYVSGGNRSSKFLNSAYGLTNYNPDSLIAPLSSFIGSIDSANCNGNYTIPGIDNDDAGKYFATNNYGGGIYYTTTNSTSKSELWGVNGFDTKISEYSDSSTGYVTSETKSNGYGKAYLNIDSSRYTDFNQIPNLKAGYAQMYHHYDTWNFINAIRNCKYSIADAYDYMYKNNDKTKGPSEGKYNSASSIYCNVSTTDEDPGDYVSWVRGLYELNGSLVAQDGFQTVTQSGNDYKTYLRFEYCNMDRFAGDGAYNCVVTSMEFNFTKTDKNALRKEYYEFLNSGINKQASTWSSIYSAVKTMALELCVPTCKTTSYTDITSWITTGQNDLRDNKMAAVTSAPLAFIVPEQIYLMPNGTSYNSSTQAPFQYYVQNDVDPSNIYSSSIDTLSDLASTGSIYFAYENADSVTISARALSTPTSASALSGGSITFTASPSASTSGTVKYFKSTISAGQSPSLSASTTGYYIEWTATYKDKVDGYTKTAIAYTYVYKPYVVPVAGGADACYRSNARYAGNLAWISGVHNIKESTSAGYGYAGKSTYNGSLFIGSTSTGAYIGGSQLTASNAGKKVNEVLNVGIINYATDATQDYVLFQGTTNTDAVNAYFADNKSATYYNSGSQTANTFNVRNFYAETSQTSYDYNVFRVVHPSKGNLYIDTSRYSNLSEIPNLRVGFGVVDDQACKDGTGDWYIASYTGLSGNSRCSGLSQRSVDKYRGNTDWGDVMNDYKTLIASQHNATNNNGNSDTNEGLRYAGKWPDVIDPNTKTYSIKGQYSNFYSTEYKHGGISSIIIDMDTVQLNKHDIRSAINYAVNNFANLGIYNSNLDSYFYYGASGTDFANFKTYYKNACQALTKLDGTVSASYDSTTELNNLAANLKSAVVNLLVKGNNLKTGTAKQYFVGLERSADGSYVASKISGSKIYTQNFTARDSVAFTADSFDGYTFGGVVISNSTSDIATAVDNITKTYTKTDPRSAFITSSNYYSSSLSQSGTQTTFTKATSYTSQQPTSAKAPDVLSSDGRTTFDWIGNKSNSTSFGTFSVIYFYFVNQQTLYFDMNDGVTPVNRLSSTTYNALNGGFYNLDGSFSYKEGGVTVTYDPLTCIYTFNGTATGDNYWGASILPPDFSVKSYTAKYTVIGGKVQKSSTDTGTPDGCFVLEGASAPRTSFSDRRLNFDLGFIQKIGDTKSNTRSNLNATSVSEAKVMDMRYWKNNSGSGIYFNNYQVRFGFFDGSSTSAVYGPNAKVINSTDMIGTLPIPEREGYNFTGWYTEPSGGVRITSGVEMGSHSRTLYAHWSPVDYHVLLDNEFDIDQYMSKASTQDAATKFKGYTNAIANFKRSPNGKYADGSTSVTNPATGTMKQNAQDENYMNINYSYTGTGETALFDHYAFDAVSAPAAGSYTVDFTYRINDMYSTMLNDYGDNNYASALFCFTDENKGDLYKSSYSENKAVSEGWEESSFTIDSVAKGDSLRFQIVLYYGSLATPINTFSANIDIAHVVIRDSNGMVVWSTDQFKATGGVSYADYENGTLDVINTTTHGKNDDGSDAYDTRVDVNTYKMTLKAGVSYTFSVDYKAYLSNPRIQLYVFGAENGTESTTYSAFWNYYINSVSTGTAFITFTPTDTYHNIYLGLGTCTKDARVQFSNIKIQPTYLFDNPASKYNTEKPLGGIDTTGATKETVAPSGLVPNQFERGYKSGTVTFIEDIEDHYQNVPMNQDLHDLYVPSFTDNKHNGYAFVGWFTADGTQVTNSDGSAYDPAVRASTNGMKLYSRWEKEVYINFNGNKQSTASGNVTNLPEKQRIYYGQELTINASAPILDGWTFRNWSVVGDPSKTYTSGYKLSVAEVNTIYNSLDENTNYELNANWQINSYDLKINPNGGTVAADTNGNVTYYSALGTGAALKKYTSAITGTSAKTITNSTSKVIYETDNNTKIITVKSPTMPGNKFIGWTVSSGYGYYSTNKTTWTAITSNTVNCPNNGSNVMYFKQIGGKKNTDAAPILTATWQIEKFRVNYMFNGSATDMSVYYTAGPYNYGTSFTVYATKPERIGGNYKFLGYSETRDISGNLYQAGDTISAETAIRWFNEVGANGTKNLYAVWYNEDEFDEYNDISNDANITVIKGIVVDSKNQYVSNIEGSKMTKYTDGSYNEFKARYNSYLVAKSAFDKNPNKTNTLALYNAIDELETANSNLKYTNINNGYLNNFVIRYANGKEETTNLNQMNLNHYTASVLNTTLSHLQQANPYFTASNYYAYTDQSTVNGWVVQFAKDIINKNKNADTKASKASVYETPRAAADALGLSNDVDAVHYVYTKDYGYTYYCYTNKVKPNIVIEIDDVADTLHSSRVSYPTSAQVTTTADTSSVSMSKVAAVNTYNYSKYTTTGPVTIGTTPKDNSGTICDLNYYSQKTQIRLTPSFKQGENGQYEYRILSYDDAYTASTANSLASSHGNYTDSSYLAGTGQTTDALTDNRITIFVSYHYSVGSLSCDFLAYPNGYDSWCNQFRMQRLSAGANNWELVINNGKQVYNVYDASFNKQAKHGCFVYEFAGVDGTENIPESCIKIDKSNPNSAANLKHVRDIVDGSADKIHHMDWPRTIGYSEWPENWSFCLYPYPSNNMYIYVHLIDRWGNTYDSITYVPPIDENAPALTASTGSLSVNESGGSGIRSIDINCSNYTYVIDSDSSYKNGVFTTNGDTVRISTGKANTSFNVTVKDNAMNEVKKAVTTDSKGNITIKVNDSDYTYNGAYSFKLNSDIIKLFSGILKYIHNAICDTVEIGDSSVIKVVTKNTVSKIQLIDNSGSTVTISSCDSEDVHTETKTWSYTKTKGIGSYTYKVKAKIGLNWVDEEKTVTMNVTKAQYEENGAIRYVSYTPKSVLENVYTVRVAGRANRIQFVDSSGRSRIFTRSSKSVQSITSYNASGATVNNDSRSLVYEIWTINTSIPVGTYVASGKFNSSYNTASTAVYNFDVKLR